MAKVKVKANSDTIDSVSNKIGIKNVIKAYVKAFPLRRKEQVSLYKWFLKINFKEFQKKFHCLTSQTNGHQTIIFNSFDRKKANLNFR